MSDKKLSKNKRWFRKLFFKSWNRKIKTAPKRTEKNSGSSKNSSEKSGFTNFLRVLTASKKNSKIEKK